MLSKKLDRVIRACVFVKDHRHEYVLPVQYRMHAQSLIFKDACQEIAVEDGVSPSIVEWQLIDGFGYILSSNLVQIMMDFLDSDEWHTTRFVGLLCQNMGRQDYMEELLYRLNDIRSVKEQSVVS